MSKVNGSKPATKPKQKVIAEPKPIPEVATKLDNEKAIKYTQERFGVDADDLEEEEQIPASAIMFKQMLNDFYSTDNISMKTELNDKQILANTSAELFAKRYNIPLLADLVNTIEIKSVSRNRKGRKESVEISKASFNTMNSLEQETPMPSIPKRLLGIR